MTCFGAAPADVPCAGVCAGAACPFTVTVTIADTKIASAPVSHRVGLSLISRQSSFSLQASVASLGRAAIRLETLDFYFTASGIIIPDRSVRMFDKPQKTAGSAVPQRMASRFD